MKITLDDLCKREVEQLVIESVDLSLYIALAVVDGATCLVVDNKGRSLKTRNLLNMKRLLAGIRAETWLLRQRSAYDEMIGHSAQASDNVLEVPMTPAAQPSPDWQH